MTLSNSPPAELRIALADDQALVRKGIKAVIDGLAGMCTVVEADSGKRLLEQIEDVIVDVVVSDIRMPDIDGFELAKRLTRLRPELPVLLLTTFDDSDLMLRAAQAGARGFLLKDVSPEELGRAIVRLASGQSLLQPVTTSSLYEQMGAEGTTEPLSRFNHREIDILRLMAGGYSNREIAESIFLAEGTVKNYVSEILSKLETRDRTRAVLKAITLRII